MATPRIDLDHPSAESRQFVGGVGAIGRDCIVVLAPGGRLVLRGVALRVAGNLVAIRSPERSTIRVLDSSITAVGVIELAA